MIKLSESLDVPQRHREVFAYLGDFTSTADWDPGTISVTRLDELPERVGSRFDVVARFRGKDSTLRYTVTELAPQKITLRGENARLISIDTIEVTPSGEAATRVTYTAEFTFKGIARLAEPFLRTSMATLADAAIEGMRDRLGGQRVESDQRVA